jgi:hypothetical protein
MFDYSNSIVKPPITMYDMLASSLKDMWESRERDFNMAHQERWMLRGARLVV